MLDGGGSTELRRPAARRRRSRCRQHPVGRRTSGPCPTASACSARRGRAPLRGLDVRPQADRVVPGLTMDVAVAGYDETLGAGGHRRAPGRLAGRAGLAGQGGGRRLPRRTAGIRDAARPFRLRATASTSCGSSATCTGWPSPSGPSRSTLARRRRVRLTGYDADGFDAPVAPRDVTLDYDKTVIDVTAAVRRQPQHHRRRGRGRQGGDPHGDRAGRDRETTGDGGPDRRPAGRVRAGRELDRGIARAGHRVGRRRGSPGPARRRRGQPCPAAHLRLHRPVQHLGGLCGGRLRTAHPAHRNEEARAVGQRRRPAATGCAP